MCPVAPESCQVLTSSREMYLRMHLGFDTARIRSPENYSSDEQLAGGKAEARAVPPQGIGTTPASLSCPPHG